MQDMATGQGTQAPAEGEKTRHQQRWENPEYRKWHTVYQSNRYKSDPEYRKKQILRKQDYRRRMKERKQMDDIALAEAVVEAAKARLATLKGASSSQGTEKSPAGGPLKAASL